MPVWWICSFTPVSAKLRSTTSPESPMRIAFLVWTILLASVVTAGTGSKVNAGLHLKQGDVITRQDEDGKWSVIKVLLIDVWPDSTETVHCRTYDPLASRPDLAAVRKLPVRVGHAPIAAASFREG